MEYEVWSEGYAITGNYSEACFEGMSYGETFDEAVIKLLSHRLDKDKEEPDGYRRYDGRLCVWGCRIFDNETDARKAFG